MFKPEPPACEPTKPVLLEAQIRADVERINDAISELSEIRPEARELARSGHPAKKHTGKAAVEHIQSEIRRLSAERRRLKGLLPDVDE